MKTEIEQEDGWTRWIPPYMRGYVMQCCDCGLKHEFDFSVVEAIPREGGRFDHGPGLDPEKFRVMFRARRVTTRSKHTVRRKLRT